MILADVPPASPSMATRGGGGGGDGGEAPRGAAGALAVELAAAAAAAATVVASLLAAVALLAAMRGTAVARTSQYEPVMGELRFLRFMHAHSMVSDRPECKRA